MSAECVNSADKSSASETSVSPAVLPERGGRPSPFAIGIDFGTSKCCVAVVRDGRVDVLENELGQRTTPSCVAFNSQQRLVGSDALSQAVVNCDNTVHGVKKFLGRTYDEVKDLSSLCRINPTEPSDIFENFIHYKNTDLRLRPEQVAAMLLGKMKDIAESSLGCPVDRAVISVPASFGNAQRLAIKNAAQVAGLEVLELINETTAAGVAFVENRTVQTPEVIAVVDFGAGKLDVSIMEILLTKDEISKVVLVGGSTRVPLVRAVLEGYFGPGKLDQTLNKDEAVARGAALRAATLSGQETSIKFLYISVNGKAKEAVENFSAYIKEAPTGTAYRR
ncbi:ribosome-associated molecular chaperone SSB1-like [Hyalella azteca]|uniref:Ribosome-associated molecular chaperone SSB1-like n=1 Tax=Hyalella azteca TaxID=294128 RepID=A0A8B7NWB1_HYAAZ|nr:ribosome-associated molecular chaperone SSB1-like [Hyalella azteca]